MGALMVLLLVVFAVGEGLPHPAQLDGGGKLGFIAAGIMALGVVAAWRSDGLGGLLILIGYGIFAASNGRIVVGLFALFPVAGLLHMIYWWQTRKTARISNPGA